jgi:hypothetical protein
MLDRNNKTVVVKVCCCAVVAAAGGGESFYLKLSTQPEAYSYARTLKSFDLS